jgi:hypothetical protein
MRLGFQRGATGIAVQFGCAVRLSLWGQKKQNWPN